MFKTLDLKGAIHDPIFDALNNIASKLPYPFDIIFLLHLDFFMCII
jgi:hypothetical protein